MMTATKFDPSGRLGVYTRRGRWDRDWLLVGTVGSWAEARRLLAKLTHGKQTRAARELWLIASPRWYEFRSWGSRFG